MGKVKHISWLGAFGYGFPIQNLPKHLWAQISKLAHIKNVITEDLNELTSLTKIYHYIKETQQGMPNLINLSNRRGCLI